MMCVQCGAAQSTVLQTRTWQDGAMLQRRRECFNGHRFTTYEISDRLAKTLAKYAEPSAVAVNKRGTTWRRDSAIVRKVTQGQTLKVVAAEYGLAATTVSWIVKRRAPEYNVRSAGQRKRFARAP